MSISFWPMTAPQAERRKSGYLLLPITIHNFQEWLAVGVWFGSGGMVAGSSLAIGRCCPATFGITFGFVIMMTLDNFPGHASLFFRAILWLILILPPDCSKI
jgi:hypothetical protein